MKLKGNMIDKKCIICNNHFTRRDTKRDRLVMTCSDTCARKYAKFSQYIKSKCSNCLRETTVLRNNQRIRVLCKNCKKFKNKQHRHCTICSKVFFGKKTSLTCSDTCRAILMSKNCVNVNCKNCKKQFKIPSYYFSSKRGYYCSKTCSYKYWYKHHNTNKYGNNWASVRKDIILRDKCCLLCGTDTKLEVHHFIPIKMFVNPDDGHYSDNLGTFCYKCHRIIERKKYSSLQEFQKDIV